MRLLGQSGTRHCRPLLAAAGLACILGSKQASCPACLLPALTRPKTPLIFHRRCWSLYFDYEAEFAGWQALYAAAAEAAAAAGDAAAAAAARGRLAELAQQTLPLLGAMREFLQQRGLDCLVGCGEAAAALAGADGAPAVAEVAVVLGPDEGADAAEDVQQGAAFPSYADPKEQAEAAEGLRAALAAAAAALPPRAQQLAVAAGPAPDDMPGLVTGGAARVT